MIARTHSISCVIVLLAVSRNCRSDRQYLRRHHLLDRRRRKSRCDRDRLGSSPAQTTKLWSGAIAGPAIATGEEMLRAVVTGRPAALSSSTVRLEALGLPVYGFGYDLNHDSTFAITDNTAFDANGFAESGIPDPPPQLPAVSVEPHDNYAEGFFTGFWHYAINDGNPFADGRLAQQSRRSVDAVSSPTATGMAGRLRHRPTLMSTAFAENSSQPQHRYPPISTPTTMSTVPTFSLWQRGSELSG